MKTKVFQGKTKQSGVTLLSAIVVMALTSILGAFAISRNLAEVENGLAEGSGVYLAEVAGATEQFLFQNWYEYANGVDIPNVANDLRPTVEELVVNGKRLLPSFPKSLPTRQYAEIFITRTNCPGDDCLVTALTCTSSPITMGRADVRFDLAATMMTSQHGIGGQSRFTDPTNIVGPAINAPNPYGNVPGIVCASARVDTALMMQFVRMGDTRDPFLRADLSAAGDINAGNPNGDPCARSTLGSQGSVAVRREDCSMSVSLESSNSTINAHDAAGVVAAQVDGLTGRASAKILRPTSAAVAGVACSAQEEGDVVLDSNNRFSLVACRDRVWLRVGQQLANHGQPCPVEGATGENQQGVAFICRGGTWQSLSSRLPKSTLSQRYLVTDGVAVPAPTDCPANTQHALLLRGIDGLIDNTGSPARNRFAHYAEKTASGWTIRLGLFDSTGARYSTSFNGAAYGMRAIAEVYCDFSN